MAAERFGSMFNDDMVAVDVRGVADDSDARLVCCWFV